MRRRQFLALLGAAAAAWPHGTRAQQSVRHIAMLSQGSMIRHLILRSSKALRSEDGYAAATSRLTLALLSTALTRPRPPSPSCWHARLTSS